MGKSGFAALVGRPNVGKSTLVNQLVGQKVAIMSDKPQTTRTQIRGILTRPEGQAVILDTPGIHRPRHRLGELMVEASQRAIRDVDVVVCVVDGSYAAAVDEFALEQVKSARAPVILVINKIDKVKKPTLLEKIDRYGGLGSFAEIVPLSALTGEQVPLLAELLFRHLPVGPRYYPDDAVVDHPERFVIAELIREKILLLTREEIPHSVAVQVEQMEFQEDLGRLYVNAVIYTERKSQKAILIGKDGGLLKRVGTLARQEIENLFGSRIFLELWVRVKPDWRNHPNLLRQFGFGEK